MPERDAEMERLTSMHPDPGGCWHRIDRIGHLAVHAENLHVEGDQMSLFSLVGHSLEELGRTEVESILGGRNPGVVLVAGNPPGSSLEDIGCMGPTF